MRIGLVRPQLSRQRTVVYALAFTLLIVAVVLLIPRFAAMSQKQTVNLSDPRVFDIARNAAIEDKYGIRFTFLAVTGDGGLLDLRYRVIDEARAANFGHFTETAPRLIAESTGAVIDVTKMGLHNHYVQQGRSYYILYRNTGDAIKIGDLVTIAIDDQYIEHVVAR